MSPPETNDTVVSESSLSDRIVTRALVLIIGAVVVGSIGHGLVIWSTQIRHGDRLDDIEKFMESPFFEGPRYTASEGRSAEDEIDMLRRELQVHTGWTERWLPIQKQIVESLEKRTRDLEIDCERKSDKKDQLGYIETEGE